MRTTSLLALTLGFLLAACASTTLKPSAEARNSLAPTGKLRVGLILSNPVLVTKDPGTGELRGVTVDLGRSLAASLGAQFEPISYTNPAALTQSFGKNEWDIAFIGLDPTRAAVVDFSQPYMEVENSYLVPANSRIRTIADADQPGIRIAVPERSVPDTYLSRNLKNAKLVRVPGGQGPLIEVLKTGRADAYAENAHMLTSAAQSLPGSRVLDGRYTAVEHAIALPKGKNAGLTYVKEFIEHAKVSGQINAAIERAGLRRVTVPSHVSTN